MKRISLALGLLLCFAATASAVTKVFGDPVLIKGVLTLWGGSPLVLEGATTNDYTTTIAVTDPTANRTITLPNSTGTVALNPYGASIEFEGATADDYETTLTVVDPTADRTITLPNATGTVLISGQSGELDNPGRATLVICGDQTTVNNNTVYYGPNLTLTAYNGGTTCDITAAGNTTEGTADAPAFAAKAFQVLGMVCRNAADANADVSYTLRTAAGATVPSVTCTIADNGRDCVADVQTTTAIASGATIAVAVASTGDLGADGFVCSIAIAF